MDRFSRAVNSLETRLGTQLLARTTRSVRPTDAGVAYLEACRKLLDGITDAESHIAADPANPVGTLTITAPVQLGQRLSCRAWGAHASARPARPQLARRHSGAHAQYLQPPIHSLRN
jgi:DNA-binding transcriptional LysR family regulator